MKTHRVGWDDLLKRIGDKTLDEPEYDMKTLEDYMAEDMLERGLARGRVEGRVEALLSLLSGRFGVATKSVEARVQSGISR